MSRRKRVQEEAEEQEVYRFFDPEEWEREARPKAAPPFDAQENLRELLHDVDEEIHEQKYMKLLDLEDVSREEVDRMLEEEMEKRGIRRGGKGSGRGDIYAEDVVSSRDPVIAELEEAIRKKTEEEARAAAREAMPRRVRRVLEYEKRLEEQEQLNASRAGAKRGAVGQIEAERLRIAREREEEAARQEELRQQRKKVLARRKRRNSRIHKVFSRIFGVIGTLIALAVFAVLLVIVMSFLGRSELLNSKLAEAEARVPEGIQAEYGPEGERIIGGVRYIRRGRRTNLLLIGYDGGKEGAASVDSALLLSLDTDSGIFDVIGIPAKAAAPAVKGADGSVELPAGTGVAEAWARGGGGLEGCRFAALAASALLFGEPVHACTAVDLRAVGPAIESLGGVAARWPLNGLHGEELARHQAVLIGAMVEKLRTSFKESPLLPFYLYRYLAEHSVSTLNLTRTAYLASVLARRGFVTGRFAEVPLLAGGGEKPQDASGAEKRFFEQMTELFRQRA